MNFLFNNLLAAKGPSPEDWIQIIVVVAIIVFSIFKAISRSIKNAMEQKFEQNEDNIQTPAEPKKRYTGADNSYKTLEELREERIAQIRKAFGIPEPPAEQEPPAAPTPQVVEKIEEPPAPKPQKAASEPVHLKIPAVKKAYAPAASTEETVHKLFFSSRADLRNAVLYQEILGKPLALRDIF
jgi:cytoskeletal protein RodZ